MFGTLNLGNLSPGAYTSTKGGGVLLDDLFAGSVANLSGRVPNVGPAWSVTGGDFAGVVAGGGEMYDSLNGTGVYYAVAALPQKPREIGCRFSTSVVFYGMLVAGPISSGKLLAIQVVPNGVADESFTQINYTTVAGDTTIAIAMTNFAAAINANATMIANGITATAVGNEVRLTATKCPRIRGVFAASPLTSSTTGAPGVTLASYITGNNALTGMVHFRLAPSGNPAWAIYNGGELGLASFTVAYYEGLQANTEYVYRCQIDGNNVSGGLYLNGTQIASATGSDTRIGTNSGASAFWESGGDKLRFKRAWATTRIGMIS